MKQYDSEEDERGSDGEPDIYMQRIARENADATGGGGGPGGGSESEESDSTFHGSAQESRCVCHAEYVLARFAKRLWGGGGGG